MAQLFFRSLLFAACLSRCADVISQDEVPIPIPIPIPEAASKYADAIESHMDYVTENSLDELGSEKTAMWLATIDIRTNGLPAERLPKTLRWYRRVTSPEGANLYWDQPTIVAAYELSVRTGCACYEDAADAYIRDFLKRCVAQPSGMFQWGNHRYYDVVRDQVVDFSGGFHECRPHTPAWESFWRIDPKATERAITAMATAHIKDPKTGLFCRHANPDVRPGEFSRSELSSAMPFLESGGVLVDSLAWLAHKTDDRDGQWTDLALQVARYSYSQRDSSTGLVRNQPIVKRWDYFASTTELGLWAGCLARAAQYTGNEEFLQIADAAMTAWLRYGFDQSAGKYYGRLSVADGKPLVAELPRRYSPPMYAEVFDVQERPTHNCPMPMAEACLSLFQQTGKPIYREAAHRWADQVGDSLPSGDGKGICAEDYGRAIHFLARAGEVLERPEYRQLAETFADEAMERLYVKKMGMFRGHVGEDRCDAVDGPGVLLLALMYLEGDLPESAMGW